VAGLGNPQTPGIMRLPTALRHQPLLGGASGRPVEPGDAAAAPSGASTSDAVAYHLAEALRLLGGRG
jgi:hypothetical protein